MLKSKVIKLDLDSIEFKENSILVHPLKQALTNQFGDEINALLEDYEPESNLAVPHYSKGNLELSSTGDFELDCKSLLEALVYVLWSEYSAYTDETELNEDEFYFYARKVLKPIINKMLEKSK